MDGKKKKYIVESFGCQMNEHDAEKLRAALTLMGYEKTDIKGDADVIIFNTCCVREHAEKRVFGNIGALKKLKDEKPWLIIGVCGCMMQQKEVSDHLFKRFPFVNIIFGTHELHLFPEMMLSVLNGERVKQVKNIDGEIAEGLPILRSGTFSTSVNIMYGCNNFCTYCIVPYVRGRERSRRFEDIRDEVEGLAFNNFKEITLLGQNVNSYHDNISGMNFPRLLLELSKINGIDRVRFMTSHPKDLSDELIDVMASCEKVCKHIHLPVQSGSTAVLHAMNRGYTRERYLSLVEKLRASVLDIGITTDIIVGFPGETDEDFRDTLSLMEAVHFSTAYTFMYSKRKGTKAAVMDNQVPEDTKKARLHELNELQAQLLKNDNEKFIGQVGSVLVEGVDKRGEEETAFGKLSCFKTVYFSGGDDLIGKMVDVEITDTHHNSLIGRSLL
ncbi:MAG: tRNA (N6-isopentenyl adenosine(37)-C2)-methylthiotransferase MiaB [Clostridia bacterium]